MAQKELGQLSISQILTLEFPKNELSLTPAPVLFLRNMAWKFPSILFLTFYFHRFVYPILNGIYVPGVVLGVRKVEKGTKGEKRDRRFCGSRIFIGFWVLQYKTGAWGWGQFWFRKRCLNNRAKIKSIRYRSSLIILRDGNLLIFAKKENLLGMRVLRGPFHLKIENMNM